MNAFVLAVATTAASLGVPIEATVTQAPAAAYELDLARSTTDTFAITGTALPKLVILPLAVGKLPIKLFWKTEGKAESVAGETLVLDVAEPPLQSPEIADIKPPLRARRALWPWLLALLAAAAAWYWWKKRRAAAALEAFAEAARDRRPPHERAYAAFEELERAWTEGRRKEFYFGLTDAVRDYLERRFDIPATRQTTAELLRALKDLEGATGAPLDRTMLARLRETLERADLVKFADVPAEASWGPADLEKARGVVRATEPPPPEPAKPAEEGAAR